MNLLLCRRRVTTSILFLLALHHGFRRRRVATIARSDHAMSPVAFVRLVMDRYRRELGTGVGIWFATYLVWERNHFIPSPCLSEFERMPRACLRLYLATTLKHQGLFADAEWLYQSLVGTPPFQALALTGLADLYFVQAMWAREFKAYDALDIVVSPIEQDWHDRDLRDAVSLLTQAIGADPNFADAYWLLGEVLLERGSWDAAKVYFKQATELSPNKHSVELRFSLARARFGSNRDDGLNAFHEVLGLWDGWWRISDLKIVSLADLAGVDGVTRLTMRPACALPIASTIIKGGVIAEHSRVLTFEAQYAARFDSAEIIPAFGMVLANEHYLISSSSAMLPCHWPMYTPGLKAIVDDRAVLCRQTALRIDIPNCIYFGLNSNYYHWLLDELPRLLSLEMFSELANSPVLVDQHITPWQIELLRRIGVPKSRFVMADFQQPVWLPNLITPSLLSTNMVAHPDAVRMMRERLTPHLAGMAPKPGKRLFISRPRGSRRRARLINEAEIQARFVRAGFEVVETGSMSIDKQIELFSDVEIVTGPGGAAMANMLFAPAGAKLLIMAPSASMTSTFTSIGAAIGQQVTWLAGNSYAQPHPYWIWTNFDFEIAMKDVDLAIERLF